MSSEVTPCVAAQMARVVTSASACLNFPASTQAATLGTTPIPVFGALLVLADASTAILVFVLARRRRSDGAAAWASLLFFANPVSILISSRHLQFDGLAILFLLAAILFSERARDVSAAAALSVSLLVKHVTGLHPLLFRRRPGAVPATNGCRASRRRT